MLKRLGITTITACFLAGISAPVAAQKAKNTVRVGLFEPVISLILYDAPNPEAGTFSRALFDPLLCFDNRTREFMPNLARTWKWVDDQTLEMDLQTGVTFHDGSEFDADDVVYTLNWLVAPNNGLRFAENFNMIKSAEKLDKYKVRIHTHGPAPTALLRLSASAVMVPSDSHGALENKGDFGRKTPIGTGPFKLESFSSDKIVLTKNTDHKHGTVCKPSASIDRLEATIMPDAQTQIASLATGNVDFMKVSDKMQADMLAKSPTLKVTATGGFTYQFIAFDAANRAGNAALSDKRVRQAMVQALNRELIGRSVTPGGDAVVAPDALCQDFQRACMYSSKPPAYDLNAAKKLLAEAGYADGFDVELSATPGSQGLAEAVAGELRKVGVRAKVDRISWAGYRDKQRAGKLQVLISLWTSGGLADASSPLGFHFAPGPRDYARDKQLHALMVDGMATNDDAKRGEIYKKAYDHVNQEVYAVSLTSKPDVFVHNKDLTLMKTAGGVYGLDYYETSWKK